MQDNKYYTMSMVGSACPYPRSHENSFPNSFQVPQVNRQNHDDYGEAAKPKFDASIRVSLLLMIFILVEKSFKLIEKNFFPLLKRTNSQPDLGKDEPHLKDDAIQLHRKNSETGTNACISVSYIQVEIAEEVFLES